LLWVARAVLAGLADRTELRSRAHKETSEMTNQSDTKPKKKSLWALLKESMDKASSGCGPGCGCHVEKKPRQDTPRDAGSETERS
jgi:hypothetical protein